MRDGRRNITAHFAIVTPMFLGGANDGKGSPSSSARIRETSLRGAICFWWRALQFARLVSAGAGNQNAALFDLQKAERKLFGSVESQSQVLFRCTSPDLTQLAKGGLLNRNGTVGGNSEIVGDGVRYFGYGLITPFSSRKTGAKAGQLIRGAIAAEQSFQLRLLFRPNVTDDSICHVLDAIVALSHFGGLGARVRRGFGSLCLDAVEGDLPDGFSYAAPGSIEQFVSSARALIRKHATVPGHDFEISAFGSDCRCIVGDPYPHALVALDAAAKGMLRFRAWGRDGWVGNERVDQAFKDDRDWSKGKLTGKATDYVPRRAAFGLPQNYKDTYSVTAPTIPTDGGSEDLDRRASPLFFHIQKIGTSFHPVALFLPTRFTPANKVAVTKRRADDPKKSDRQSVMSTFDFSKEGRRVIDSYLDGRSMKSGAVVQDMPYFPTKVVIHP